MNTPALAFEAVPGLGPRAFLLHGILSSRLQWEPNLPSLSRCVRPVVFDLWGHGTSPAPTEDGLYTIDELIRQLETVRQSLGDKRIVIVGQSFGSGLAFHYALRHPERVQALVFTNAVSATSPVQDMALAVAREQMAQAIAATGSEAIRALPMHPRGGKRIKAELRERLALVADAVSPVALVRLMRITAPQLSVAHRLHEIRCPVLLVNGRHEVAFQSGRDRAELEIPDCEVVDLEAGHAVNLEAADGFNAAVVRFIASIAGGASPHPHPKDFPFP